MLADIANEQAKTNRVTVIIGNDLTDDSVLGRINNRVDVKLLRRPPGSRNPRHMLKLYYMLRSIRPDIAHAHLESFAKILRWLPIPKVLTVHNTGIQLSDAVKDYDAVFSISNAVKDDLEKRYPCLESVMVPNGIVFGDVTRKSQYGQKPFRIVQVSRLDHKQKGQDILLRALRIINDTVGSGQVYVDFIGEGGSEEYLLNIAEELDLTEWCNFLGQRSRKTIYENLHSYDLLVQPSRYEGFGLTVVEAMAALLPVLVSNVEGPMEIIDRGKYGYFFETDDHRDCAEQIMEIMKMSSQPGFTEVRQAVAESMKSKYDVSFTAKAYLEEYENVIKVKK